MRDYITHELQKVQSLIEDLEELEQNIQETRDTRERKNLEGVAQKKRIAILNETQSPSAIYQFFAATEQANGTDFRTEWQSRNLEVECLHKDVRNYYRENFEAPNIDLALLPAYSFVLQFTFTLAQPYISRNEQDFYIIDNPVRKDKILGLPYVASTSWKGSLRAALWKLGYQAESNVIRHLFGNEKGVEDQALLKAGHLYFFPTYFTQKSLEIINPQNRERRAGAKPIAFESVPKDAKGNFTLLYVPDDLIGQSRPAIHKRVAEELELVFKGVQAMFREYGFGAKTSSGFGLANEIVSQGTLIVRIREPEKKKTEESIVAQAVSAGPALPRYLEAPDRLKAEYLTPEGVFRERSEAELKKMGKNDKQLYDKARSWWQREGRELAEAAKLPQATPPPVLSESEPLTLPVSWPEWPFTSFVQLIEKTNEVVNMLQEAVEHE